MLVPRSGIGLVEADALSSVGRGPRPSDNHLVADPHACVGGAMHALYLRVVATVIRRAGVLHQ
jgi:hypothetical protein